jgi:hypothetical protein
VRERAGEREGERGRGGEKNAVCNMILKSTATAEQLQHHIVLGRTDGQTDIQIYRYTERQRKTHTHTHTHTRRQTEAKTNNDRDTSTQDRTGQAHSTTLTFLRGPDLFFSVSKGPASSI